MEGNISGYFLCLELGIWLHSLSIVLASEVFKLQSKTGSYSRSREVFSRQSAKSNTIRNTPLSSNDYQNFQLFLAASSAFLSVSSFNRRL
jgi:hypothetical protein